MTKNTLIPIIPLNGLSRNQIKDAAYTTARNEELANDLLNNQVTIEGNRHRAQRQFMRHFNKARTRLTKDIPVDLSEIMSDKSDLNVTNTPIQRDGTYIKTMEPEAYFSPRKSGSSPIWNSIQPGLNRTYQRISNFITNPQYRAGWINRHITPKKEYVDPSAVFQNQYSPVLQSDAAFVDLSNNAYVSTGDTPPGAITALGSEFMESSNPSVFTAGKFKTLPPTYMMRDSRDMPLGDISLFHGVENGTYKVMPLSQFNDSTIVVPVRSAYGHGGITQIVGIDNDEYESKAKEYHDKLRPYEIACDIASDNVDNVRDSLYNIKFDKTIKPVLQHYNIPYDEEADKSKLHTTVSDSLRQRIRRQHPTIDLWAYLYNDEGDVSPELDSLKTFWLKYPSKYEISSPELDVAENNYRRVFQKLSDWTSNNPKPEPATITFEDGAQTHAIPYSYGKFTLGNSKGGFYINHPDVLKNAGIRQTLQQHIDRSGEPLYPVVLDNGAFSEHIIDRFPQQNLVQNYLKQGYGVTDDNVFVIGTKLPGYKSGGILKGQIGIPGIIRMNRRLNYPKYVDGSDTGVDACAAWSNQQLRDLGADIWSNAWSLNGDIKNIISGYDGLVRPTTYSRSNVEAYNNQAADNIKSKIKTIYLDPNEAYAVNMYYLGSASLPSAYSDGKDSGTHTGLLRFNNDTFKWEVAHNIHRKLHVDELDKTLGSGKQYGITSIYHVNIPNKNIDMNTLNNRLIWKKE